MIMCRFRHPLHTAWQYVHDCRHTQTTLILHDSSKICRHFNACTSYSMRQGLSACWLTYAEEDCSYRRSGGNVILHKHALLN